MFARRFLASAIAAAAMASAFVVTPVLAQSTTEHARQSWNIPAGSLEDALSAFAATAGTPLSFEPTLVAGKRSNGLRGDYSVEEGFDRLLQGSGLEPVRKTDGTYTLQPLPSGAVTLAPVKVSATGPDGSAEQGYRSSTVSSVGPWEGRSLQDTPYSIHVTSAELIQNLQAINPDQVYKITPTVQIRTPQSQNDTPLVQMRGFISSSPARNGIPGAQYAHGTTTEDVERIEILTGLSGFLYGPGNVGGVINYVSKRPTSERYNNVTLGYTDGSNFYAHGDFGGPIDAEGRFGYRINAVAQDGETWIDDYDLKKSFISAAFDWKLTDRLLLQIDGSHRDYRSGRQAYWGLGAGVQRPSAKSLDPSVLWSQKWGAYHVESDRLGANLRWEASDALTLRAAYLDRRDKRTYTLLINTIRNNGTYDQIGYKTPLQDMQGYGWNTFADISFTTGPVAHKITAGYLTTFRTRYDHADGEVSLNTLTGAPLDAPTYVPEPVWPAHGQLGRWNGATNREASLMIGDDIVFNERWSALIGVSRSTIETEARANPTASLQTTYDERAVTPTASLLFKPVPNVTTYVSYMEALEPGAVAANVSNGRPVTNADEILEPLISEQIEAGVKARVGGMDLTAALFQIDKSLQYYDLSVPGQATFVQDGLQVHRGVELTATGKLSANLTLAGGVTLLDASTERQKQNPALEGKVPAATAEQLFKLYGEYRIAAVPGLSLNSSLVYNGASWGDAANTDRIPSYALLDAGARYMIAFGNHPLTLRLNVSNLTDKRYWVNSQYLGDARTVLFSVSTEF